MLRRRRDVISAFGDGERDNADLGRGERIKKRRDVIGPNEIDHRAGDAGLGRICFLLDDGCQPVLFFELLANVDIGVTNTGADNRPVMIAAGVEQIVEIDRLMRPVKIADANMNDAGAKIGALVFRTRNACRQARKRRRRKFDAHD